MPGDLALEPEAGVPISNGLYINENANLVPINNDTFTFLPLLSVAILQKNIKQLRRLFYKATRNITYTSTVCLATEPKQPTFLYRHTRYLSCNGTIIRYYRQNQKGIMKKF